MAARLPIPSLTQFLHQILGSKVRQLCVGAEARLTVDVHRHIQRILDLLSLCQRIPGSGKTVCSGLTDGVPIGLQRLLRLDLAGKDQHAVASWGHGQP